MSLPEAWAAQGCTGAPGWPEICGGETGAGLDAPLAVQGDAGVS